MNEKGIQREKKLHLSLQKRVTEAEVFARYFLPIACQSLFVVCYFFLVARYFLVVARYFLLVACYFFVKTTVK